MNCRKNNFTKNTFKICFEKFSSLKKKHVSAYLIWTKKSSTFPISKLHSENSKGEAKLFKGSINKHKQSCPHNYYYDDFTVQYNIDKQAHENVLKRINEKGIPDFIDPANTITLKDLDDDFTAAEVDSMILGLSEWSFESGNAAGLLCSY